MTQRFPAIFLILLASLFILNLVQSSLTELIYDEAYYWYYAQNMDWGFFDHPPMVAFLIKIGSFLFDGELGVRFISCVLSVGTYVVLWLTIDNPKKKDHVVVFFLLLFSTTLLNAYGFFTLPDTPLLFFTALFLWLYKLFLEKPSYLLALAIGVVMAALMYSKYHAVLVIVFVLLSNLKLLREPRAWFAVIIALLCYIPHFVWLYGHDFVSIKYHIYERPNQAYSFSKFTLGYLVNLVAIFGLLFFWVYKALLKTNTTDLFVKALKYLSYGVIIFFFVSSFNRRVQTQWVVVISIPLAILTFNYILENSSSRKWVYRLGLVSLVIMLYARAWLVYKPLFPLRFETHDNTVWVNELKKKSKGVPVIFENSYRRPSMYSFYSGKPSFALNNHMYRKSQYSIDESEKSVQNKRILYVTKYAKSGDIQFLHSDNKTVYFGTFMDNFESFRKLQCIVDTTSVEKEYSLKIYNPYNFDVPLSKLSFSAAFSNAYKQVKDLQTMEVQAVKKDRQIIPARDTLEFRFELPKSKFENPKYFRVGVSENGLLPGLNGIPVKI
ncbi:ArnT family glycosyltransferase [Flagellimonas meridianipacifica]|uniref:Dolichyl-phosphate-mannose-protein mannosyltransferase n=1 Tax=Flagellimonas meridianipacifica TaxID=1080225 RepID=A0A2T0MG77_9FLAO|nr:glycosyltransferase family 39 protein [Allomuricauda pacifica]PRX56536.1 dolichyl-phosphate-mannose-protein mannosyltransferase [Allomuricauda pacifica]